MEKLFYKGGKVEIAMRGTEITEPKDVNDLAMGMKKLPNQYVDAQQFYEKLEKIFQIKKLFYRTFIRWQFKHN